MRRIAVAAAAALISTAAHASPDLICGAPTVLLGDEPFDRNPVVSVEVSYRPDLHAWRIFHHLADGAVVSRGEQYVIVDLSNERKAQWRGSLNRNRSLLMIGEVRNGNGALEYHGSMTAPRAADW